MDSDVLLYLTGEEVHAGDRVQYDGNYGTVVVVNSGAAEEFSPGYEDYSGTDPGVWVCDDDGATRFIGDPDERLAFLDRS